MASVLISNLIAVLQQPGLMPGMEEERQQLLQLFTAILPAMIPALGQLICADQGEEDGAKCVEEEIRTLVKTLSENSTWLSDLNAAAYEVDDIIDEFRYATLRAEAETDCHQSGDKVRTSCNFSLICKLITSAKRLIPSEEGKGIMMRERLTEIVIRMGDLVQRSPYINSRQGQGLMPSAEGWQDPTLPSLEEITDLVFVGRESEREKIVGQLLHMSQAAKNIVVFSIVGIEGAGKSILTRLICRDARIKDCFEIILWVDVGNEFNINRIAKSVVDQVIGKDCCLFEGDPDLLQRRIYQELSWKRCLLVLDNVQIEGNFEESQILISWLNQSAFFLVTILINQN